MIWLLNAQYECRLQRCRHEDGSGGLDSPDGRHMFSYDLMTSEYTDPVTGKWCFWKDYPEHMNLQPFKAFAEEYVRRKMLPQDT